MAMRRSDWIEVGGASLHWAISGTGPATLVLVHEMGGSIESWDEVVEALGEGFQVLRYDQRGFGRSEKSTQLSMEQMVDDLAALLEALQIKTPVFLAGAALGAALCMAFALRHPDLVKALVLSSPATGGMPAAAMQATQARMELVRQGGLRAVTDIMLAVTYPAALRLDQQRFERYRQQWLVNDPESFIAFNFLPGSFDLLPRLPELACPCLVIGCSLDAVRPAARSAELAALIPGALYEQADSGHYMPVQTPALFAEHLRAFLGGAAFKQ